MSLDFFDRFHFPCGSITTIESSLCLHFCYPIAANLNAVFLIQRRELAEITKAPVVVTNCIL